MKRIFIISFFLYLTLVILLTLDTQYLKSSNKKNGHIIDYKYTNVNGHAHKRKYDFTTNQYLGDWKQV